MFRIRRFGVMKTATVVAVLYMIFVYGLFGWVFTAIALAIYNLAARWVGGIEVEVETVGPPPPVPTWGATLPPSSSPPTIPPAAPSDPAPPDSTV